MDNYEPIRKLGQGTCERLALRTLLLINFRLAVCALCSSVFAAVMRDGKRVHSRAVHLICMHVLRHVHRWLRLPVPSKEHRPTMCDEAHANVDAQ